MDNVPTIFNHCLQQRESEKLDLRVLVRNAFLERLDNIFCMPWIAVEGVADLEVRRPVGTDERVARRALDGGGQRRRHLRAPTIGSDINQQPATDGPTLSPRPKQESFTESLGDGGGWPQEFVLLSCLGSTPGTS